VRAPLRSSLAFAALMGLLWLVGVCLAAEGDAGGYKTGNAADVMDAAGNKFVVPQPPKGAKPEDVKAYRAFKAQAEKEPLAMKLADAVGQNRVAINLMWTLLTGFLVMFMQAGFALVETGFCRAKNAAHTMFMNFFVYPIGILGFWLVGFALMFGGAATVSNFGGLMAQGFGKEFAISLFGKEFGLWGTKGWLLSGIAYDTTVFTLFLFQLVFMDTAATIPTGAMAERWKLSAFVIYGFFMTMFLYPLFGNWAWGGGWLANLGVNFGLGHGYVDFAGSGVVHAVGGLCGLAGAMVLGPRIGKYNRDGSPNVLPGHNIPMAVLGTFILAFGWFGFNPGSTLGASGGGNLRIGVIATVTMLASASGALAAAFYTWWRTGKPDPTMACNGMLAGLVAITAPSGFVGANAAILIGAIAGILVCFSVQLLEKWHVDDPVVAISVHGTCGLFGVLSVGIFADGTFGVGWNGVAGAVKGCLYGDWGQLAAQLIGCATLIVWAFGVSWVFFKVLDRVMGLRVPPEVELEGLDLAETGVLAYHGFVREPEEPVVVTPPQWIPSARIPQLVEIRRPSPVNHEQGTSSIIVTEERPAPRLYSVVIEGANTERVKRRWERLCHEPHQAPPEFHEVYRHLVSFDGREFVFRGGDPERMRKAVEKLFEG
jgi:Amt family ammonium transporter